MNRRVQKSRRLVHTASNSMADDCAIWRDQRKQLIWWIPNMIYSTGSLDIVKIIQMLQGTRSSWCVKDWVSVVLPVKKGTRSERKRCRRGAVCRALLRLKLVKQNAVFRCDLLGFTGQPPT